ncbi:hypothetical protein M2103_000679 [Ereboglobus sp. PH5-5]|nr:hypothetical protein [Ereboglobus sp. PH5-10]MDF9832469.1 hypothetical protein [Ereboglobus sp. PH5-5]
MVSFSRMLAIFAVLFCTTGAVVRADILTLANGDKLKGKLIKNLDGMITFKSDILGEIIVPTTKASVEVELTPEQQAALAAKAAEEKRLAEAKAAEDAKKAAETAKKKPKIDKTAAKFDAIDFRDMRNAAKKTRSTKVDDTGWVNRIEFGLTSQTGRVDKLDIYLRTENNRRTPKTETRFLNRYTYGETNDERTADSISSNLRFRRTLSGRLFFQSNTRYDRNRITLVGSDVEQGVGMGYNVLSGKQLVIASGLDAAMRHREYMSPSSGAAKTPTDTSAVINVFQDVSWTINRRFSLTQDFVAVLNTNDTNDQKYNFNAGLTGKITNTFNITTRVELEYNKLLASDLRYFQRITTTLGYIF